MSTGPVGFIGSVATGQLQQSRGADGDRAIQDSVRHARVADAANHAEKAAGIGEMEQDEATSERDADGHRLWEQPPQRRQPGDADSEPGTPSAIPGRDPTGEAGTQLDLSG